MKMKRDYEIIATLLPKNFEELKSFIEDYNNNSKPLSAKSQEKVRKFMHKLYSNYNSWVADKIVHWSESNTSPEQIEEEFFGATKHFGPQTKEAIDIASEKALSTFTAKNEFDKEQSVRKTFYVCAENVLSKNKQSLEELNQKINSVSQKENISMSM